MTILYKPVQIESAEQAEALPDDAIVIGVETGERYTRSFEGDWWGVTEMGTRLGFDLDVGELVTALVPIEAEAETVVAVEPGNPYAEASMDSDGNVWFRSGIFTIDVTKEFNEWASKNQRTRYVTPWEDA